MHTLLKKPGMLPNKTKTFLMTQSHNCGMNYYPAQPKAFL